MFDDEVDDMHYDLAMMIRHEPTLPLSVERFWDVLAAYTDDPWYRHLLAHLAMSMSVVACSAMCDEVWE